jgi:hypothetical protein
MLLSMSHKLFPARARIATLAFVAVAIQLVSLAPAASAELEQPPKIVGIASNSFASHATTFESEVGIAPGFLQLFWSLEASSSGWLGQLEIAEDFGAQPYIEITTSDLGGLVDGSLDAKVDLVVSTVKNWLDQSPIRRVVLAPLPEANLVDFPWGADPAGYKAGYDRIRQAFRDAGVGADEARFIFAMHGTSSEGLSMADFYPGDAVVDMVGFSIINRNNPWHDYDSAFQRFLDEIKGTITQAKPILVTQTASVIEGQDRAGWLDDMFTNLGNDSQVIGIIYFNRAKTEGGKYNDYRVIKDDGWIDAAFRQGARDWASPGGVEWLFNGEMDSWVANREEVFAGAPYFVDAVGSSFEVDILWLAGEGITQGCNPPANDRFCPSDRVTRGQMAAFLVRALGLPAAGAGDSFMDDNDSVFESDIERLAAAGITSGCNPPVNDRFCPDKSVTRGQMAAFLARALGG